MSSPTLGSIVTVPVLDRLDLLSPPGRRRPARLAVAPTRSAWSRSTRTIADTAAMSEAYDLAMDTGANCVVVGGRRDGEERVAACLVRADTRADVNNLVKRTLDVRKASFLSMDRAVEESGMEYGGITPVGLPAGWRLLVDSRVARHRGRGHRLRRTPLQAAHPGPARRRPARRRGDRRDSRAESGPDCAAWDEVDDRARRDARPSAQDRKWDDLLQELRVMQTGAQLTAGFLLTLPFQPRFADLDDFASRRSTWRSCCCPP